MLNGLQTVCCRCLTFQPSPWLPPSLEPVWYTPQMEGVQPLCTPDDCIDAENIAKADAQVQSLLKERYGLTDMSLVICDPWSVHASPVKGRCIQLFMYRKSR